MNGQFDDQIDDQFDRSFATAINRTYSRENLFNILKYENGSSMRGTYLELTEISIAEKESIHLVENLVNHGRNFFRWFSSRLFCTVNPVEAKNVCCLSDNRLWFYFSANCYDFRIGILHGKALFLKIF